jgi:tetratricopeptide (TPR) repeat protein
MKKTAKPSEAKLASGTGTEGVELDARAHTELFSAAMKCFTGGDYAKALALFEQAADGPQLSVNESARMYGRMCRQRLGAEMVDPRSAEDHYNYAVTLLNAQRPAEARGQLEQAVARQPLPHYLYALALTEGLLGAIADAARDLRRAIEADPAVRSTARRDADFAPLLQHPEIREILVGEPASSH